MVHFPSQEDVDRGLRSWKALMDFGYEFSVSVYRKNYPGQDPLEVLRGAWCRKGDEHTAANEQMLRRLSRER